ncbi:ATP-binding protein [Xanthomonas phaseoli]|uniref:ATP-binding protein n=1 Tax=Xanthomonas phaseoli TaxID=1985254 RepID=UPI0005804BDD|nr:ATP-binding protein [Xanthomonas phaseoli]ATS26658.1 response regulator [Xanthomonas phaseoli pv. phaseoli]KHS31768.1 ATPase [Xanthomonas phaseoli pv. phaseoli]MBO9742708.1 response regulator [Xanthomonas phaseoli pv. phaseoli]SOO28038.1 putative two-component system sensor-response regulator hybrid protein [Xanthomonas phaseoli pv. phaseoli]SOO29379.1 putative two-component system sensor-response regulator hybrid protein [Xanthomonas phaseoli pv. phaseoli]
MPERLLARTEQYYRRILYGSAAALSFAIIISALLFGSGSIDQYRDHQMTQFVRKSEGVQNEVDKLSARLTQFASLYESIWKLRQTDAVPLHRYAHRLVRDGGVVVTDGDLTAIPFTVVSSLNGPQGEAHLAMALRVVRDLSGVPSIDARKVGVTLEGFIYSQDARFLASSPVMSLSEMQQARSQGPRAFVESRIGAFEQLLASIPPNQARQLRPLWLPADSGERQVPVSRLAVPMYQGGKRVLTMALSLPDKEFMHFFLGQNGPDGRFFLLSKDAHQNLGDQPSSSEERALLAQIDANLAMVKRAGAVPRAFYKDGVFYVVQRISGPAWIAVSAYPWQDLLQGLRREFITATLICVFALGFIWASAVYFDLRITKPLLESAEHLIEAQHFSKAIIDTLPIGIGVYAPDTGSVLLENPLARHMRGGKSLDDGLRFYRHVMQERSVGMSKGVSHSFVEVLWTMAEGKSGYIGVASSQTRFEGRPAVLLGLVDLNERKANERLLVEAKHTADEANRAKSMFLAIVSHEIRTPLHGAMGHLELLSRSLLGYEQREWVEMIQRSFDALLGLVNDLLDSTKLEANALQISPVAMSPNQVVESCARSFEAAIIRSGVAFYCLTDPDADQVVEGDEQRLTQILQNLLGNAAKFTERGSIAISSRRIRQEESEVWIRFEVRDTGIGIPAAMQSAIFKSLAQADDSISRRYGGTGLGLFLCRNLSHLMGGEISVRSEPGVGSVFRVDLPFKPTVRTGAQASPLHDVSAQVVCGDPSSYAALVKRLRHWGATVVEGEPVNQPIDIRLIAQPPGGQWQALSAIRLPRLGTVSVTVKGPFAPRLRGQHVEVSSMTSSGLLDALIHLTGGVVVSPEMPRAVASDESIGLQLDILIAEDDAVNRTLIKHQLAALGCQQVRIAVDGVEALEMWLERRADLVITDLGMPGLDGVGLLQKLRELDPEARVVATSASAAAEIQADTQLFSDQLQKPVLLSDLRRVLRTTMLNRPDNTKINASREPGSDELDVLLHQAFRAEWGKERDQIEQALLERDRDVLCRRVHRLQGALMALGLDQLVDEVKLLQRQCVKGDWITIFASCRQLIGNVDTRIK